MVSMDLIKDLEEREHQKSSDYLSSINCEAITVKRAAQLSKSLFLGERPDLVKASRSIFSAKSFVPLVEQLLLHDCLSVPLYAEGEDSFIKRYGVTVKQLKELIGCGLVVPDLFEFESQMQRGFEGYLNDAGYLIEVFEDFPDTVRIGSIRRGYSLSMIGIDPSKQQELVRFLRKELIEPIKEKSFFRQATLHLNNPDLEWTLPHHLARLMSLSHMSKSNESSNELLRRLDELNPTNYQALCELYASTIYETMDQIYEVQYFGQKKTIDYNHFKLFTDNHKIPKEEIHEISSLCLNEKNDLNFSKAIVDLRSQFHSEIPDAVEVKYPLDDLGFQKMKSFIVNNNERVGDIKTLRSFLSDKFLFREQDADDYLILFKDLLRDVERANLSKPLKKRGTETLLSSAILFSLGIPTALIMGNDAIAKCLDAGISVAASLSPMALMLLIKPKESTHYPMRKLSPDSNAQMLFGLTEMAGMEHIIRN